MEKLDALGIIAGSGVYPLLTAEAARRAGVSSITAVAFNGETDPKLETLVDHIHWLRVGQLARMHECFRTAGVHHAIMAGQIAPKNLFDLRPDWKALLLLARLKRRNAETIFGAIADGLARDGIELLAATTFLEDSLAPRGLIAGGPLRKRDETDVALGIEIAHEISRLDIGQTVIVRNGTVLAVEAFEGTNEAIKRGGALARKRAVMIKVAKPNQDLRFDVPVIGLETIRVAAAANIRLIVVEAGKTLLLEKQQVLHAAEAAKITIVGR
ncbi:MAG: UDP-2,3-diacylglucosamine diphosphatase LpxI [Verrucomicrobiota bacterium]|nr:UDP-2,3-diacylglucosamine diphosphatase LpxI [Verrucomicrobiota bacterium]